MLLLLVGVPGGDDRVVSGFRVLVAGLKLSVLALVLIPSPGRSASSNIEGCVRLYDVRTSFSSCYKNFAALPASLPVFYCRNYCTDSVSIRVVLCRRKNTPLIPLSDLPFLFGIYPSKLMLGALVFDSGGISTSRHDTCLRGYFVSLPLCKCCIVRSGLYVLPASRLLPFLFFVVDFVGCPR